MSRPEYGFRYVEVAADDLRRELYVTAVGRLVYRAGQAYPVTGHAAAYNFDWDRGRVLGDFQVVLIEAGGGLFESRQGVRTVRAGDVMLLVPGSWHRYRPDSRTGWRELWLSANGEYLHRLRGRGQLGEHARVLPADDPDAVAGPLLRLHRTVTLGRGRNDLAVAGDALAAFGCALRADRAAPAGAAAAGPAPANGSARGNGGIGLIARTLEFIRDHSHRPLSVDVIAREMGVSRRTLERRFAAAHGRPIVGELAFQRVERAKQLLAEGDMSVKEIAYAAGFGDARRLIRTFGAMVRTTPQAYRHEIRSR